MAENERPSAPIGEEYMIGRCFNKENYDPNYVGPDWNDLLDLLVLADINIMEILFCGKVYPSQGNRSGIGGTGFDIVKKSDVQHAMLHHWDVYGGKLKELSTSPKMVPVFAQTLLKLEIQPEHITGIVVRKLA